MVSLEYVGVCFIMDQEAEKGVLLGGVVCLVLVFEGGLVRCVPLLEGVCGQPDVLLVLLLCGDDVLVH